MEERPEEEMKRAVPGSSVNVSWILGSDALPSAALPGATALIWDGGAMTYGELRQQAMNLASVLQSAGVQEGDRVAVHLVNRPQILVAYFGCAYAGATLVPVNFRLTAREITFILSDCTPAFVISESEISQPMVEAFATTDAPRERLVVLDSGSVDEEWSSLLRRVETPGSLGHTDVQLILYTSGTTGRPKGVLMSHQSILWFALQQAAFYPNLTSDAVTMLTGPMYNTAALNEQSIPTLLVGGTVAIMPSRGWSPEAMSARIDDWGVSHAVIYPSMMEPLIAARSHSAIGLASMRFVLTGGENCPPSTMARFMDAFPHIDLMIGYGSTEGGVVTCIAGSEIREHPGSVGRAMGGQTFAVVDRDGTRLPVGDVGRVVTAAPSVTQGYWNAPELTQTALREGWLDTGDLGRIDGDGYLFIEGRSKDMIISKGQNIYPAEIENALLSDPVIVDCAVLGVPDPEFGEVPLAVVVARPGAEPTEASILASVRERLASFKKPRHVLFVDAIPRNTAAKVDKERLAADLRAAGRLPQ
jgi:acyl-CoA synthetase (AMP-forming)/AMP-acid ligase II